MYIRGIRHRNAKLWHVCAGRVKHVVDLELMVWNSWLSAQALMKTAPAGRPTLPPKVGAHAPEDIPLEYHSCVEALRQNT